jgi:hypothetical protein
MRLFNASKQDLEAMYDGQIYNFGPCQSLDFYDKVTASHILMKLEPYGVVEMPEKDLEEKAIETFELKGLRRRWQTLDMRLREWRTMNKEREAGKLSAMQPTDLIIETCKELDEIEKRLEIIQKDDRDLVHRRLNEQATKEAQGELDDRNLAIGGDSMTHKVVGKRKVRDAVQSPGN